MPNIVLPGEVIVSLSDEFSKPPDEFHSEDVSIDQFVASGNKYESSKYSELLDQWYYHIYGLPTKPSPCEYVPYQICPKMMAWRKGVWLMWTQKWWQKNYESHCWQERNEAKSKRETQKRNATNGLSITSTSGGELSETDTGGLALIPTLPPNRTVKDGGSVRLFGWWTRLKELFSK